jgi:hypothetical protein
MILLRCGGRLHYGFPHMNLHSLEEQSNGLRDIWWVLVIGLALTAGLLYVAHRIELILRQQSKQYMKFIYQLYPWKCTNQKPSIVEQTEEQAIKTSKELSTFYSCLVVVRYPNNRSIFCMAEKGELTELDTLKTTEFI